MFVHSMGSTEVGSTEVGSTEEPSGAVATGAASNNVASVNDRGTYNSIKRFKPLGRAMKSAVKPFALFTCGSVAIAASLTIAAPKGMAQTSLISQNSRAEQTCVSAARDRGLQIVDVTAVNETSGGAEVIMEVQQRRNGSSSVGCDYSNATHNVELYRIEGNGSNSNNGNYNNGNSNNGNYNNGSSSNNGNYNNGNGDGWRNQQSGNGIRNQSDAESIARQAVGDQLGIDNPNSSVVRIDDVQRNGDRDWVVEGRANGAPFKVRLRSDDGSVQDFQLF